MISPLRSVLVTEYRLYSSVSGILISPAPLPSPFRNRSRYGVVFPLARMETVTVWPDSPLGLSKRCDSRPNTPPWVLSRETPPSGSTRKDIPGPDMDSDQRSMVIPAAVYSSLPLRFTGQRKSQLIPRFGPLHPCTASAAPSAPNPTTWPGRPVSASCLAARAANVPPEETGFSLPSAGASSTSIFTPLTASST